MGDSKSAGRRGRPRAFDTDEALERAMRVFWQRGYEGASVGELTESMGVNRPSLYAAFGGKEELFLRVLDRYDEGPSSFVREALEEPTARAVVRRLLRGAAEMHTDPRTPPGCLMVHGALSCGAGTDSIRRELNSRRAAVETALRKRLLRAKVEGDLRADANPADLARYVMTVVRGMAVQATGGASRAELLRVVQTALRAWPE